MVGAFLIASSAMVTTTVSIGRTRSPVKKPAPKAVETISSLVGMVSAYDRWDIFFPAIESRIRESRSTNSAITVVTVFLYLRVPFVYVFFWIEMFCIERISLKTRALSELLLFKNLTVNSLSNQYGKLSFRRCGLYSELWLGYKNSLKFL